MLSGSVFADSPSGRALLGRGRIGLIAGGTGVDASESESEVEDEEDELPLLFESESGRRLISNTPRPRFCMRAQIISNRNERVTRLDE